MHYFDMKSQQIAQMQAQIRELEAQLASAQRGYDVARDEVHRCWDRERMWMWRAIWLGALAVMQAAISVVLKTMG